MYPAKNGDCFLISLGEKKRKHILIDSGYAETYHKYLKEDLLELKKRDEKINLFIVSHIDEDHILGAIAFIEDNNRSRFVEIDEVWYNCYRHLQVKQQQITLSDKEKRILRREITLGESYVKRESSNEVSKSEISVKQGSSLGALLLLGGYRWNTSFGGSAVSYDNKEKVEIDDVLINILSPNTNKVEKLKENWLKELSDRKWNFNITRDELFDDAFEFMMLMYEEPQVDITSISLNEIKTVESVEKLIEDKVNLDTSPTNGSSIAICINYKEKNLLFLADGHPDILETSIYNLGIEKFDLIKVPHHGSKRNMTLGLSKLLKGNKYLISTNGKNQTHPDLESLAKIIYMHRNIKKKFFFNYKVKASKWISTEEIKKSFNLDVSVGDGTSPIDIVIDKEED